MRSNLTLLLHNHCVIFYLEVLLVENDNIRNILRSIDFFFQLLNPSYIWIIYFKGNVTLPMSRNMAKIKLFKYDS